MTSPLRAYRAVDRPGGCGYPRNLCGVSGLLRMFFNGSSILEVLGM